MAEYIDKQAVYEVACRGCTRHGDEPMSCFDDTPCERLTYAFVSAPAADVVPVRRGRWERVIAPNQWGKGRCSACKVIIDSSAWGTKYCPACGARMDGGADNATD